jgi:ABC-type nickel/cobalt efflux system permease component RcnA
MEYLVYLTTAFGLGAAHALEPGHGKTLVAAYLTGTKGRISDAFLLGLLVTIFHTFSVFVLALIGIWIADFFIQYNGGLFKSLDVISGLIILGIGLMLFWRRFIKDESAHECECHLAHVHHEDHIEVKKPASTIREVISLGFASGISPCPSAIVALIASITLGGYGKLPEALFYLIVFSLGLSSVLVIIGIALILSKGALSQFVINKNSRFPVYISQFSTFLIIGLGLYLTIKPFFIPGETVHFEGWIKPPVHVEKVH